MKRRRLDASRYIKSRSIKDHESESMKREDSNGVLVYWFETVGFNL